jgi:hypothetical protein
MPAAFVLNPFDLTGMVYAGLSFPLSRGDAIGEILRLATFTIMTL